MTVVNNNALVNNVKDILSNMYFLEEEIFNVILYDSNSVNEMKRTILSGEMRIPKDFQSIVFKVLGIVKPLDKMAPMNGDELHEYLRSLQVIIPRQNIKPFPDFSNRNFDELISFLKDDGNHILKFSKKKLFSDYCRYGYVLEMMFNLHRKKWYKKEIREPFNIFIQNNLNISSRHALRLRTVGKIWFKFKGLEHLSISFDEFYRRREEIVEMLESNSRRAFYWSY